MVLKIEITNEQREKDIQELCKQVLDASPNIQYAHNGDWTQCPFCSVNIDWEEEEMSNLKHDSDCAYLIAKDLSTNGG
jgi:hypothetical protein